MALRIPLAVCLCIVALWYWCAVVAFVLLEFAGAATHADEVSGLFAFGIFCLSFVVASLVLRQR